MQETDTSEPVSISDMCVICIWWQIIFDTPSFLHTWFANWHLTFRLALCVINWRLAVFVLLLSAEVKTWAYCTDEAIAEIFTRCRNNWNDLEFCKARWNSGCICNAGRWLQHTDILCKFGHLHDGIWLLNREEVNSISMSIFSQTGNYQCNLQIKWLHY